MGWNTVWENVSILAEYNADRNIPSIDNYQQCLEDICTADNDKLSTAMASATMTGTAVNNNIYEIMPTATITDIQITMVIIGLLLGTSAIIGITSLIRKMFGNGSMNTQENDNTEVVIENGRDYVGEKPVEFIRAKSGILFKNIPPLEHHDI
ncbi:unnamed protein product [Mytilus edulis]|uniref:Uncharacterized protein n=1 Tax=Mytilus edulis TaxID=6550 RepID=A0A8S3TCP4_MYTED|nr:unnamed protein product [Mytilus edulis]